MKKGMLQLIETRRKELSTYQDRLGKKWTPFIHAVDKYLLETRNRKMNIHERRTVAQCLQNAFDENVYRKGRLFEDTTESDLEFLGVQLPVIASLLPTLVLNDIAIVQALDRRLGSVFYFDVDYGSDKGAVSSGDTMIGARTGHAHTAGETAERRYAMAMVEKEDLGVATGEAAYTGQLAYAPGVKLGTIIIYDGSGNEIGNDSETDGVIADATDDGTGVTGTVTAAGVLNLDFTNVDLGSAGTAKVSYHYQYDLPYDETCCKYKGVPEVDFTVAQDNIVAEDFTVSSKYSVGASIDLMKAHGIVKIVPLYSDVYRKAA